MIRNLSITRYLVLTISRCYSRNLNSFDRYSSSLSHPSLSRFHRATQIGKSIVIRRFADSAQRGILQVARAVLRGVTEWKWRYRGYTGIISNVLLELQRLPSNQTFNYTLLLRGRDCNLHRPVFRFIVFSLSLKKPRKISS